jgi:uncharacterized membrane protein HdeD (DUF308 family)
MVDAKLIAGDVITALGAFIVYYGYTQDDKDKTTVGTLIVIIGVGLLYYAALKKLKNNKAYLISNAIYAFLGLVFFMLSFGAGEKVLVRTMAASVLIVAGIALNVAHFNL